PSRRSDLPHNGNGSATRFDWIRGVGGIRVGRSSPVGTVSGYRHCAIASGQLTPESTATTTKLFDISSNRDVGLMVSQLHTGHAILAAYGADRSQLCSCVQSRQRLFAVLDSFAPRAERIQLSLRFRQIIATTNLPAKWTWRGPAPADV